MDERDKVGVFEREIAAWNRGDLGGVIAELDPDHEWELTRSGIPGEKKVHRGRIIQSIQAAKCSGPSRSRSTGRPPVSA